jgi:selenide,water dikinase
VSHKDIVLLGGGHAHVHVLKAFGARPEPGVRITLISRGPRMLYSGMLPGVIAGLYAPEEAHVDLRQLSAKSGATFIEAEVVGLDLAKKRVELAGLAPTSYDLLSVDVGIAPELALITGSEHAIAVKPIGEFVQKLDDLLARCCRADGARRIAVIGGGAAGVELLLSLRTRILVEAQAAGLDPGEFSFALATEGEVLPTHNGFVRSAFRRIFAARHIALHEHSAAVRVAPGRIEFKNGATILSDEVLITTGAAAPSWFRSTGLALDNAGFLATAPTLQVVNNPDVFAAGDCATLVESPRDKAGVFAVRAGPPLAANLRRRARGQSLRPWRPQRRHLAIISTGERYGIASRGWFKVEGASVWRLKDWIDRRWMRRYPQSQAARHGEPLL